MKMMNALASGLYNILYYIEKTLLFALRHWGYTLTFLIAIAIADYLDLRCDCDGKFCCPAPTQETQRKDNQ